MIIGIDASRANKTRKTGTEWYAYSLIRWFAQLDNKNEYILYTDKPLEGGLLDLTDKSFDHNNEIVGNIEYDQKGFQKIKSPHNNFKGKILKWPMKYFWTQGRLSLEMIINKPDVLFVPSHALPVIHPENSIVTIHDIGFDRYKSIYKMEDMGSSNISKKIINLLANVFTLGKYRANTIDYFHWSTEYALKKASKIITVSNFSKNELLDVYNIGKEKIKVIYNGYNRSLYQECHDIEKTKKILEQYGVDESPYLLYVGRLEKKKNTSAMIEAFAIMKDRCPDNNHKLILIGEASYGYDDINYVIKEFGLDNEVIITGWAKESDLPYIYSKATAFVFPSLYEGFGIPLLQAMACKTPIIASDTSSIPEVLNGSGLLFDPNFSYLIAEAMEEIISNDDLKKSLVKKGEERVKNFGWKKCAEETLQEITN